MNSRCNYLLAVLVCSLIFSVEVFASDKGSKLLTKEINERYELRFYGQKVIGGSKGKSAGPNLLQTKGSLDEIFEELFPHLDVLNESKDNKTYELELRFYVPKEEVMMEIAEKVISSLNYEIAFQAIEKEVYAISISDLSLAQKSLAKFPENAKSFSKGKNSRLVIYGYPISEVVAELNEGRNENRFHIEGERDERVGIEISDMRNSERIIEELENQGLRVEKISKAFETLVIKK